MCLTPQAALLTQSQVALEAGLDERHTTLNIGGARGANHKGTVSISMTLRTPLDTPQYKLVARKEIVVDAFPAPGSGGNASPGAARGASASARVSPAQRRSRGTRRRPASTAAAGHARAGAGGAGAGGGASGGGRATPAARQQVPLPSNVLPAWVKDPFNVDLMVSYDVIQDEVCARVQPPSAPERREGAVATSHSLRVWIATDCSSREAWS